MGDFAEAVKSVADSRMGEVRLDVGWGSGVIWGYE